MLFRGFARQTIVILLLSFWLFPVPGQAKPTTAGQAHRVVQGWLAREGRPLGAILGQQVTGVQAFKDGQYGVAYYVVNLDPAGFVVLPADDLVEPIIAFAPRGQYNPSADNPLGALINRDVPQRVAQVREMEARAQAMGAPFQPGKSQEQAQQKWQDLESQAMMFTLPENQGLMTGLPSVSDPRVDPLVKSEWDQMDVGGRNCYNAYTPNNYPCGCVATATAQVMRYFKFPEVGVGTQSFTITVDGEARPEALLGGDGKGGAYDWDSMPLVPNDKTPDDQLWAIGVLTHDVGVAVGMAYTAANSSASLSDETLALVNTFKYANAILATTPTDIIPIASLIPILNSNLDAGLPALLGMHKTGTSMGHAIVADGYGYNLLTLYHHLNMGWSGSQDAWYNLPNVDSTPYSYDTVDQCIYNIYKSDNGEIISGRVVDGKGAPISGAAVQATKSGGGTYSAITNNRGIYALAQVPSASTYTIKVSKAGYWFKRRVVATGTSAHGANPTGNLWGVNFAPAALPGISELLLLN